MKRLIWAVVSVGVIGGAMVYFNRQKTAPVSPAEPMAEAVPSRTMEETPSVKAVAMQQPEPQVSATAADSNQTPLLSPVFLPFFRHFGFNSFTMPMKLNSNSGKGVKFFASPKVIRSLFST